jgi:hypothetical protein
MAADQNQGQRIQTWLPAPTATLDVQVGITDTTGTKTWVLDAASRGEVSLFASGTGLTVTGSNLNINIAQQTATALAISRDGAVNSATHGLFTNVLQGDAVLSATNGLFSNVLQGNAVLSATNGLFGNILQGNAVLSATHGIFTNILKGDAVLSVSNSLPVQLTDGTNFLGTVGNPVIVSFTPLSTGTDIYPYHQSAAVVAPAATDTHTYTPSGALDGYIRRIAVQAPGYANFVVKRGATTLFKFSVSPAHPMHILEFPEGDPLVIANGVNLTIQGTNDGAKDSIFLTSWAIGTEV